MNALLVVAKNEFSMVAGNPLTILFMGIMVVLAVVNALGAIGVSAWSGNVAGDIVEYLWNVNSIVGGFFFLLTLCLGVISIADERSKGTLGVILTKPLYRRDVVLGKLTGIALFLLLLITVTIMLFTSALIMVMGNPGSIAELVAKVGFFILLLFMYCCFTLGLVALFSMLLSKGAALIMSLVYICFEWYSIGVITPSDPFFGALRFFDPFNLYWKPFLGMKGGEGLLSSSVSMGAWLNFSWPYIALLALYVAVIILVDSILFNREGT